MSRSSFRGGYRVRTRSQVAWRWARRLVLVAAVCGVSLLVTGPAHADHVDPKFRMTCNSEPNIQEPPGIEPAPGVDSGTRQVRIGIVSESHSAIYESGTTALADYNIAITLTHGSTNNDDFGSSNPTSTSYISLQADGTDAVTQVATYTVRSDSAREHDETFTVSFKLLDEDENEREDLANYVVDVNDPAKDNKCESTIIDNRDDALDVSQSWYFVGEFESGGETVTGDIGQAIVAPCTGTLSFYADWIPRYQDSLNNWHDIGADSWGHDILFTHKNTALNNATFSVQHNTKTVIVSYDPEAKSGQYGLNVGDSITVPYVEGTITGGGSNKAGLFDLRVRPRIDGVWQPYLKPMNLACNIAGGL